MGDVAGIGPEIIARAWPELLTICRPVVVGDPAWLNRGLDVASETGEVRIVSNPDEGSAAKDVLLCLPASEEDLSAVQAGKVSAAAGKAAYDFLCTAIDLTHAGEADGIVTAPLHKEGLKAARLPFPGHTEILAERTGVASYGMMLYARGPGLPHGLGVVHVTLHMALHEIFEHLTERNIADKIRLLDNMLPRLQESRRPRIGVAALNPHASDGGIFGDQEERIIHPAVEQGRRHGIDVSGPWPADALFVRARDGEFHGIVAMYHDQGHIPLKLLAGRSAVNITVGLPIVRTSVAHGTAYDIAGQGIADASSLVEAARVAARLVSCPRGAQPQASIITQ